MKKRVLLIFAAAALLGNVVLCQAQPVWEIPYLDREIQLDGFIEEWEGVPALQLSKDSPDVRTGGELMEGDVKLDVRALWDSEYLYLALSWADNAWDIKEIGRKDAVWIDSDNRRRDRMYFYDNLKFHIRKSDYDYTLWMSPRINEEGPFVWARLLEGYKGMERATGTPMVSSREQGDSVTMEVLLLWKQLRLDGKKNLEFPLTLVLSDGDHPDRMLDFKANQLKWVGWVGKMRVVE